MLLSFQVYSILIESAKNSQYAVFVLQNEGSNSLSYQTYPKSTDLSFNVNDNGKIETCKVETNFQ